MADTRSRAELGLQPIRNGQYAIKLVAAGAINPDRFVVVDSNGKAAQATASAINVVGVYVGAHAAVAGELVAIECGGIGIVEGDGSVAAGDLVASNADGRATTIAGATGAVTIAADWLILGVALTTDGSAGETIQIKFFR